MSKKIRTEAVDSLFEAILSLQDKEECYAFFEDVSQIGKFIPIYVLGGNGRNRHPRGYISVGNCRRKDEHFLLTGLTLYGEIQISL